MNVAIMYLYFYNYSIIETVYNAQMIDFYVI